VTDSSRLATALGGYELQTPLVASCGTVGSVVDFAGVADLSKYGAAVAKSVSATPWEGRPAPRMAPAGDGMLNGIGIQNPGVAAWTRRIASRLEDLPTDVWGSAVGHTVDEFSVVAVALESAGVNAVEINLSCPNLDGNGMFALDLKASAEAVAAVRAAVKLPIGAKLSPNSEDIVSVASAVYEAGADWVVLGNTVWGMGIDIHNRRPLLSGGVGGYSGRPIKPIALRCVWAVNRARPDIPIVGSGGVTSGDDVVEFLLAGASAVGIGTAHFASPRIGGRILKQVERYLDRHRVGAVTDIVGAVEEW
jgi:dihydroorotate dehydrogenase (NAD+) catalytic subunit